MCSVLLDKFLSDTLLLELCKLLISHLIFDPVDIKYVFLAQCCCIDLLATEFHYPLWLVSFLLLAMISLCFMLFVFYSAASTLLVLMQSVLNYLKNHSAIHLLFRHIFHVMPPVMYRWLKGSNASSI